MRVGLLIVRVELTGDPGDPLRARVTELLRLDRPETQTISYAADRDALHDRLDRWLDAVLLFPDEDLGGSSGAPADVS